MTLDLVNVGTTPNDNTGDQARAAFIKVNAGLTSLNQLVVSTLAQLRVNSGWDGDVGASQALGPTLGIAFLLGNANAGDQALRIYRWDAANEGADDSVSIVGVTGNTGAGRYVLSGAVVEPILTPFFPQLASAATLLAIPITVPMLIPANFTGSAAIAVTAPQNAVAISVKHYDASAGTTTTIGTVSFAAATATGSFSATVAVALDVGDTLILVAPTIVDPVLSGVGISINVVR